MSTRVADKGVNFLSWLVLLSIAFTIGMIAMSLFIAVWRTVT